MRPEGLRPLHLEGRAAAWPRVPESLPPPSHDQQPPLSTIAPRMGMAWTLVCLPGRISVRPSPDRRKLRISVAKADGRFPEGNHLRSTPIAASAGVKLEKSSCDFMLETRLVK